MSKAVSQGGPGRWWRHAEAFRLAAAALQKAKIENGNQTGFSMFALCRIGAALCRSFDMTFQLEDVHFKDFHAASYTAEATNFRVHP